MEMYTIYQIVVSGFIVFYLLIRKYVLSAYYDGWQRKKELYKQTEISLRLLILEENLDYKIPSDVSTFNGKSIKTVKRQDLEKEVELCFYETNKAFLDYIYLDRSKSRYYPQALLEAHEYFTEIEDDVSLKKLNEILFAKNA